MAKMTDRLIQRIILRKDGLLRCRGESFVGQDEARKLETKTFFDRTIQRRITIKSDPQGR